jgi:hypothetical protein
MRYALSGSIYKYLLPVQFANFSWINKPAVKNFGPLGPVHDKMLVNPKTYIFAPL